MPTSMGGAEKQAGGSPVLNDKRSTVQTTQPPSLEDSKEGPCRLTESTALSHPPSDEGGSASEGLTDRQVVKNVVVISVVFLLLYTSYTGLSVLQSSLHSEGGLGVYTQSLVYAASLVSSLFLPRVLVTLLGHKRGMAAAILGYILWMAANGYAVWGTMVTASIIVGMAKPCMGSLYAAYFTIVARKYARMKGESVMFVSTKFFGIFFIIYRLSE